MGGDVGDVYVGKGAFEGDQEGGTAPGAVSSVYRDGDVAGADGGKAFKGALDAGGQGGVVGAVGDGGGFDAVKGDLEAAGGQLRVDFQGGKFQLGYVAAGEAAAEGDAVGVGGAADGDGAKA